MADPHEFIARAKLLAERARGKELKQGWEALQKEYLPHLYSWPWSVTNEIAELEQNMRKLMRKK